MKEYIGKEPNHILNIAKPMRIRTWQDMIKYLKIINQQKDWEKVANETGKIIDNFNNKYFDEK